MSTQETALFNVNIIISNDNGAGELPGDEKMADIILRQLNNAGLFDEHGLNAISVDIAYRTGELE